MDSLQKVVESVEGAVAGVVMGFDGIAVNSWAREGATFDVNMLGVEFSGLLAQLRRAGDALQTGEVREVCAISDQVTLIVRMLTEDYFMALALDSSANLGKGRYHLRMIEPEIRAQFFA